MIKRPLRTETIKENTVRYIQVLEGDNVGGRLTSLVQLLKDLIDQPLLLKCANLIPDEIKLTWDEKWTMTSSVITEVDMTKVFYNKAEDDMQ